jgi:signal transduction histidine kinase
VKPRLLLKLLGVNLPLLVAVPVVLWLAIDYLAADYFMTLMQRYHVNPADTHRMFLDAVHRYILWVGLGGVGLTVLLSLVLTRRVLRPLSEMVLGARRIAQGDYGARVRATSRDEVGELGRAFNAMADNLAQIEELRKTMVSDVAHELRTPLTNIRGYLEGLRDGVVEPTPETFAMLQPEVLRLVRLVDDLSQLTRADAALALLRREPVDMAALVEEAVELFAAPFADKGIELARRLPEDLPAVTADRARLLQVLRNLLDNALSFTPPGGTVTVSVARSDDGVRLTVTNSGAEIPAADLPFVFERFYRVDKSRSLASGGAGIGLAIVKQLVEAHGGQVGAESSDATTRVWVALPS